MTTRSFYEPAPAAEHAEETFNAYLHHLEQRNGDAESFSRREQRMAEVFDNTPVRASTSVDGERFNRNYVAFTDREMTLEELALLAFVKINAGEAYGVRCLGGARRHLWEGPETVYKVEKVVLREEDYHTRLLVGATKHFEGLELEGAWTPTWPLRLLIGALAKLPAGVFHPVLLGAELSGLHAFNWLLNRLKTLFPNDVAVRESMEQRLMDVLVDEVGHVSFNRVLVGETGRAVARKVARAVTESHRIMSPELVALGMNNEVRAGVESFDYPQLPREVRDKAFFA